MVSPQVAEHWPSHDTSAYSQHNESNSVQHCQQLPLLLQLLLLLLLSGC
jgi:hypothetical protein